MPEDYQILLDEAKSIALRIQALDKLIQSSAISPYLENISITLTPDQLQPFVDKRAELKTRKDEICDQVKNL